MLKHGLSVLPRLSSKLVILFQVLTARLDGVLGEKSIKCNKILLIKSVILYSSDSEHSDPLNPSQTELYILVMGEMIAGVRHKLYAIGQYPNLTNY